jgi:HAD superfamily hydrolase (TIGR01490 family)
MKPLAIFDVDGTIFRSSLFIELVEALIEHGIFPKEAKSEYEHEYYLWLNRHGDYERYLEVMIASFLKHIKGVSYTDFMRVSEMVVAEKQERIYRYTRDLVKELKSQDYFLLAISQSPKGVLDLFCKNLGFDKVYGRFYELGPHDRFTGEVTDLHLIANKANIVRRALTKENVTLEGSVGVGDTEGDIPFLELVEKPICFNPNMKLYKYASLHSWPIVVERKDVIYRISAEPAV